MVKKRPWGLQKYLFLTVSKIYHQQGFSPGLNTNFWNHFHCENFYEISPRSRRDLGENCGSRRDTEISAAKTRRDREVISRRDMDISAGSFAARPRWESCGDLRGFAARNEIPGSQNLTVIPSRSEILGSQIRFDEDDIYIYVNN